MPATLTIRQEVSITDAINLLEAEAALECAKRMENRAGEVLKAAQATYREACQRVECAEEKRLYAKRMLMGGTDNAQEMTNAIRQARRLRALEKRSKRSASK